MFTRGVTRPMEGSTGISVEVAVQRVRPALWQVIALVSVAVGVVSSWRVTDQHAGLVPPLAVALTMTLVTFAGWYVWSFFTYLADRVLFGGTADYNETLGTFARVYIFQALFVLTVVNPLGWMWGWIALYCTVAAWGMVGPRYLGMRTWQAITATTLGMLVWVGCLLVLTLTLKVDGLYVGVGPFLI